MADFSHLGQFAVRKDSTAVYPMTTISVNGKSPKLTVRPATQTNEPYFNAVFRGSKRRVRAATKGNVSVDMINEQRDLDRELFPLHVVTGWEDQVDAVGAPVPFTLDNCRDFLRALPDELFDDLRDYCSDVGNFQDVVDVETSVGNSSSV